MSLCITWGELLEYRAYVRRAEGSRPELPKHWLLSSSVFDDAKVESSKPHLDAAATGNEPGEQEPAPAQMGIDISSLELDTETLDLRIASHSDDALRDQAVLDFVSKQTIHRANFEQEVGRLGLYTAKPLGRASVAARATKKLDY